MMYISMMYISNKTIEVCRQSISSDCVVSAVKNKIHFILYFSVLHIFQRRRSIKVITKLPNSEQSYKGKVQTRNYINRQNQSPTGKL